MAPFSTIEWDEIRKLGLEFNLECAVVTVSLVHWFSVLTFVVKKVVLLQ